MLTSWPASLATATPNPATTGSARPGPGPTGAAARRTPAAVGSCYRREEKAAHFGCGQFGPIPDGEVMPILVVTRHIVVRVSGLVTAPGQVGRCLVASAAGGSAH